MVFGSNLSQNFEPLQMISVCRNEFPASWFHLIILLIKHYRACCGVGWRYSLLNSRNDKYVIIGWPSLGAGTVLIALYLAPAKGIKDIQGRQGQAIISLLATFRKL